MLVEDGFNLHGVDVFPAPDDHILLSPPEIEIAVFIHAGQIPRVEPPAPHGLGRCLLVSPVPLHDLGTPDNDFPHLTGRKAAVGIIHDADHPLWDGTTDSRKSMRPFFNRFPFPFKVMILRSKDRHDAGGFGHAEKIGECGLKGAFCP